jgi:hypothetical protein
MLIVTGGRGWQLLDGGLLLDKRRWRHRDSSSLLLNWLLLLDYEEA